MADRSEMDGAVYAGWTISGLAVLGGDCCGAGFGDLDPQQLGLPWVHLWGFADSCPRFEDRNLHQTRPRFGRDEGGRHPLRRGATRQVPNRFS